MREILKELVGHYYTTHNAEACEFCKKELDQAISAIKQEILGKLEKPKLTYEHREIKLGGGYVKETDARYNAGFNDCLSQVHKALEELFK